MEPASDRKPARILTATVIVALVVGILLFLFADRLPAMDWEPDLPEPRRFYAPYSGRVPGEPVDSVGGVPPTSSTLPVWDPVGV